MDNVPDILREVLVQNGAESESSDEDVRIMD